MKSKSFLLMFSLCFSFSFSAYAGAQFAPNFAPNTELKLAKDTQVWAQLGKEFRPVAELKQAQVFQSASQQPRADFVALQFGNNLGFVSENAVQALDSNLKKSAGENSEVFSAPDSSSNQLIGYVLTQKRTPIYSNINPSADPIAYLETGLRYPITKKIQNEEAQQWYLLNFAGKAGFIRAEDVELDKGLPIITYHHILQDQENKNFRNTSTTVSESAFRFQMKTIKELGFETINLADVEGYLKGTINLPAKATVITFDDGLTSANRYALPILQEYGFSATMFVITSRIKYSPQPWNPDSLQFLSVGEYEQMAKTFDYQSHTHFLHRYLKKKPIAIQRSYHNLMVDFERSIRELKMLNPNNSYISYPFGGYNALVIQAAKDAGFRLGLTTKVGKVKFGDDPFQLKRVYLLTNSSAEQIAKTLEN